MRRHRNVVKSAMAGVLACAAVALLIINGTPRLLPLLPGLERVGGLECALPPDPAPLALDGSSLDHIELLLPPRLAEPLNLTTADLGSAEIIGKTTTGCAFTPTS
jgi:hypothetical protein